MGLWAVGQLLKMALLRVLLLVKSSGERKVSVLWMRRILLFVMCDYGLGLLQGFFCMLEVSKCFV